MLVHTGVTGCAVVSAVLGLKSGGGYGLSSALVPIVSYHFTLFKWFMLRCGSLPQHAPGLRTGLHVQSPGGALSRAGLANTSYILCEVVQL